MPKPWKDLNIDEKLAELDGQLINGVHPTGAMTVDIRILDQSAVEYLNCSERPLRGHAAYLHNILDRLRKLTEQYVFVQIRIRTETVSLLRRELDGVFASPGRHYLEEDIVINRATREHNVLGHDILVGDYLIRASGAYWLRMGGGRGFQGGRFLESSTVPIQAFFTGEWVALNDGWESIEPFIHVEGTLLNASARFEAAAPLPRVLSRFI